MEISEIKRIISDQYAEEKSKKFILHLIRSFYPESQLIGELPKNKISLSCCITREMLSVENAYTGNKTDTVMCADAVTALRLFADQHKDTDEFIRRACTINRVVSINNKTKYKRS